MDKLYKDENTKNLFSPKQQKIIYKYMKDSDSFQRMRREFKGNKFKEPIKNGYANN